MRMTVLSSLRSAGGLLRALRQRVERLNTLLEGQRRSNAQMETFCGNVAHELRSPLATLIAGTELTLREPGLPPAAMDRLGENLEELRRMQGIVADMLFLSKAYGGERARREPVDSLAALAREVGVFHEAAIEDAGLTLRIDGDAAGEFDAPLLKRALSNLVSNATRYANAASVLRIGIEAGRSSTVRLWVANDGEAILPHRLVRLFDRFYRAEPEPGCGDHAGVGLSIVDAIARMHGGAPFARSDAQETRIGLTLRAGGSSRAYTARRLPSATDAPTSPT